MLKKITALILSLAVMLPCLGINAFADNDDIRMNGRYNLKYKLVYDEFMKDTETLEEVGKLDRKVVFISVSDGEQQAKTVCGTGKKLETALERAFTKARATDVTPLWFKLDVVTRVEEKSYTDFKTAYAGSVGGSLRQGIAFNDYFGRALLETQINSNGWLSYETGELDLEAINKHFRRTGKKQLEKIPGNLYLFNTQSYFTDSINTAYKLTTGKFSNSGRRTYVMNKERLEAIAEVSSHYLADMVGEDGNPFTPHTTNAVPFCVVGYDCKLKDGGKLADIAPSLIKILGLEQPEEMTGESLII